MLKYLRRLHLFTIKIIAAIRYAILRAYYKEELTTLYMSLDFKPGAVILSEFTGAKFKSYGKKKYRYVSQLPHSMYQRMAFDMEIDPLKFAKSVKGLSAKMN